MSFMQEIDLLAEEIVGSVCEVSNPDSPETAKAMTAAVSDKLVDLLATSQRDRVAELINRARYVRALECLVADLIYQGQDMRKLVHDLSAEHEFSPAMLKRARSTLNDSIEFDGHLRVLPEEARNRKPSEKSAPAPRMR